jgi:hypothetical protein
MHKDITHESESEKKHMREDTQGKARVKRNTCVKIHKVKQDTHGKARYTW